MIQSAKEFWKEKFNEYPQTDADKLAVAMMAEYGIYLKELGFAIAHKAFTAGYHFGVAESTDSESDDHVFPDKETYLKSLNAKH